LSWKKPFKAAYKDLYNECMATAKKSFTAAGNVPAPSKHFCQEWVKKAWEVVPTEVVKKSFRACGISVSVDGSEDDEIHCIKEGGVAAAARPDIARSTATLLPPHDVDNDEEDPFGDLQDEDEEELEGNEVVIDLDC